MRSPATHTFPPAWSARRTSRTRDDRRAQTFPCGGESAGYDPSSAAIFAPYTATLYHYLHNDLNIKRDVPYEIISDKVQPWNYRRFTNNYANALGALNEAMTKNPHMKVFVASGYCPQ